MIRRRVASLVIVVLLLLLLALGSYHGVGSSDHLYEFRFPRWGSLPSASIGNELLAESKVIVMAKMSVENTSWVVDELKDWQHAIYHMDDPSHVLHPPKNVGREAMAYLTFLIDHYHNLPEVIVFLHPHLEGWPQAWHTDAPEYNNINSIHDLQLDYVRQHGYANLRCRADPGCVSPEIQMHRKDGLRSQDEAFADAWKYFFGDAPVPTEVGTPCCSQFAISGKQVIRRPRSDYLRYRQWLLDTDLTDELSGRVMEYMWHIIFGKGPIWCPDLYSCYCEQFGRC